MAYTLVWVCNINSSLLTKDINCLLSKDIHCLLSLLQDQKVVFQPRDSNSVADRIVRETISFTNYVTKLYSIMPDWIIP